jgi:hypothetical protein
MAGLTIGQALNDDVNAERLAHEPIPARQAEARTELRFKYEVHIKAAVMVPAGSNLPPDRIISKFV